MLSIGAKEHYLQAKNNTLYDIKKRIDKIILDLKNRSLHR